MNTALSLSIVVIGKNEASNLDRCFKSIEAARNALPSAPAIWEVIFVDAGSEDNSCEIAASYADKVLIVQKPNTWTATARAVGLKEATGELVLLLDGDMELDADWLTYAAPTLLQDPQATGVIGIRDDIYVEETTGHVLGRRDNVYGTQHQGRAPVIGGAVLLRRSRVSELGGYRVVLRKWSDPDIHARALSHGSYFLQVPAPFIRHFTPKPTRDRRRVLSLLRPGSSADNFGIMFRSALRERYLTGLIRVFPTTFLIWGADVASLIALVCGKKRLAASSQFLGLTAVALRGKTRDYVLARVWGYGAISSFVSPRLRRIIGSTEHDVSMHGQHLEYRRYAPPEDETHRANENRAHLNT